MRAPAATKTSSGKSVGSATGTRKGLLARIKQVLGISPGPCVVVHHYEDIKSLSNVQPAVRRHERVELPMVTHNKLTGTW